MSNLSTLQPTDAAALLRDGLIADVSSGGELPRYEWTWKARVLLGMVGPDERAALGKPEPVDEERLLASGE